MLVFLRKTMVGTFFLTWALNYDNKKGRIKVDIFAGYVDTVIDIPRPYKII